MVSGLGIVSKTLFVFFFFAVFGFSGPVQNHRLFALCFQDFKHEIIGFAKSPNGDANANIVFEKPEWYLQLASLQLASLHEFGNSLGCLERPCHPLIADLSLC